MIKPILILDYKTFHKIPPPTNSLTLIGHLCKRSVLAEICGLNYRLKPKKQVMRKNSLNIQVNELKRFIGANDELYRKYCDVAEKYTVSPKDFPILFSRQTCIYAIEEILQSQTMTEIEDFKFDTIEKWEAVLKYLLAVNYVITQIKKSDPNDITVEALNPKYLPLNELAIDGDPIFESFRGYSFMKYIETRTLYAQELIDYFKSKYDLKPEEFIYHLLSLYVSNNRESRSLDFYYEINASDEKLFEELSQVAPNADVYKLLSIRKSPFVKIDDLKFALADNAFLIFKAYAQFLNDFWFDWLKPAVDSNGKQKYQYKDYRSMFGYFFENYLDKLLKSSFKNLKYSQLLTFDQLKYKTSKGTAELADIYLRHANKTILGQVKSSSIYDEQKYGGAIEILYKADRDGFFKTFGLDQIIESIKNLTMACKQLDTGFNPNSNHFIYPCIIVNDVALQTPFMAQVFNIRFQELLKKIPVNKKRNIKPLSLIHISDIELLENEIHLMPKRIFEVFKHNHYNSKFIPPFYISMLATATSPRYPTTVMKLLKELAAKYQIAT